MELKARIVHCLFVGVLEFRKNKQKKPCGLCVILQFSIYPLTSVFKL